MLSILEYMPFGRKRKMREKQYVLGVYEKAIPVSLSWQEKLESAQEAGYDFLELSIDETEEKLARLTEENQDMLALQKAVDHTAFPVRSLCLSGHRRFSLGSSDPEKAQRSLSIMKGAIALSLKLGIRIIMLAGYDVYYEESTLQTGNRFRDNLDCCVEMAEKAGVMLAFETMETPFMNTVAKAMKHVRRVDSPFLAVYPDIGNLTNAALVSPMNVTDDLQSGKGHLVGLHLKETVPGRFRNMMFGEGDVDFPVAIRTAWNLGVRRFVTEFWYLGEENWKERLFFARKTMGDIIDLVENGT